MMMAAVFPELRIWFALFLPSYADFLDASWTPLAWCHFSGCVSGRSVVQSTVVH
jgi:hypothetical protein